jgi:hypothetical protein
MSYLIDTTSAVKSLCPDAQFVMNNNDYSTIQWHVEPETIPTQAEVTAELKRLSK